MSALDPRVSRWLLWGAPFAVLALALGLQTGWGGEWRRELPPDVPVVPAPVDVPVMPEYRIEGGVDAMHATVERPLFNATRRPAPTLAAASEAAKPAIQRGQFVLTGTMIVDKVALAFLKEAGAAGKSRTVKQGDAIGGMRVASVEPGKVVLALGDETEEVELKVLKGPKTTVEAAPPPQPVQAGQPAAAQPGAVPAPAVGQRRSAGQSTAGPPGTTAEQNLRQNRRNARAAEAQANPAQGQGATPQADPNQPPRVPGSWENVYRNMQRPRQ